MAEAKATSTRRNYATDWRAFARWCDEEVLKPCPRPPRWSPSTSPTSPGPQGLDRRAPGVGIAKAHRRAGYLSPTEHESVRLLVTGIRRTKGMAPAQKSPLLTSDVLALVATRNPDTLAGARDRAILLVGYMGAFRRSELVALDVEDLEDRPEGVALTLRRSKVDQEGHGRRKVLVYGSSPTTCPVTALRAWLAMAGPYRWSCLPAGRPPRPHRRSPPLG